MSPLPQPVSLAIKRALYTLGVDVRLVRQVRAYEARRKAEEWRGKWAPLANQFALASIVDVGANTGQFAQMIRTVFPEAAIYSFEPLSGCYRELQERLAGMANAQAFNLALGAEKGTATIRRTAFTPCSSMLAPADLMRREIRETADVTLETVSIDRLDDVLPLGQLRPPVLLKLDVQGFELEVLRGAPKTLAASAAVAVEVAFQPLYDGQPTFDELYTVLRSHGFTYRGSLDQNLSKVDGRILEADALFVRPGYHLSS